MFSMTMYLFMWKHNVSYVYSRKKESVSKNKVDNLNNIRWMNYMKF